MQSRIKSMSSPALFPWTRSLLPLYLHTLLNYLYGRSVWKKDTNYEEKRKIEIDSMESSHQYTLGSVRTSHAMDYTDPAASSTKRYTIRVFESLLAYTYAQPTWAHRANPSKVTQAFRNSQKNGFLNLFPCTTHTAKKIFPFAINFSITFHNDGSY